jgi:hypothetical protein
MLTQEDRIRLIHGFRNILLDHIFDELCRKPSNSPTQNVSHNIVATAERIRTVLSDSQGVDNVARGLFVLALQHVVDSFIAGLLTDEAFVWLAEEQQRLDQILFGGIYEIGGMQ